jgi:hypothetical protein
MSFQTQAKAELELRRRRETGTTQSSTFKTKYRNDPAGFIRDCVTFPAGEEPTPYQLEMANELPERRRVSVRGPHGLGKTALAALLVLWFALTRDGEDWKIPTTASAWRQLTKFLWPEIRLWARRIKWDVVGRPPLNERNELQTRSLKLETGEAFALASDNAAMIEGAHAAQLLYIFDEAKVIPRDTWDAAEGAFASGECYWLAISTPGEPNGRFYDLHRRKPGTEDWWVRHVTLQEAIAAGRVNRDWAEQRKRDWGENSAVYQNRVLGEFATSAEDGVIALGLVERANELWYEWVEAGKPGAFVCVGVDVGRGGDNSVYARRFDKFPEETEEGEPEDDHFLAIGELERSNEKDTMAVTGRTRGILDKHGGYAIVDVIGVGAGVVDRLREQDFSVVPFNASEKSDLRDASGELGFTNKRAAGWWNMRELLENEPVALPPDDRLTGDLTAPKWRVMSGGKIQVESKDKIKERIGRSTDDGDAVIEAFFPADLRIVQFVV